MKEAIAEFLQGLTNNGYLTVAIISMFPLVELKGAIPVGTALGLELWQTALLALVGSTLVSVPIFFLLRPFFEFVKRFKPLRTFIEKVEGVFRRKAQEVADKSKNSKVSVRKIYEWGVYIFVAIPLPLTGVWTGTAVAVFLGLKFRECILPIALGNLTAGSIITLLTFLFKDYVEYIILGLFAFAIIMLIVFIIKVIREKPNKEDASGISKEKNNKNT